MIRLVKVKLLNEDGDPLGNVFVHFDIAGDEEVEYQHFATNSEGYVVQDDRAATFLEGSFHIIVTRVPEEDRIMLGYPSQEIEVKQGVPVTIKEEQMFSAPNPEFVRNQEELKKLKTIYKQKENEMLGHLKEKEISLEAELKEVQAQSKELGDYKNKLKGEYEKVWDDSEDVKAQGIKMELDRQELDERERDIKEAISSIEDAREHILSARESVNKRATMLEVEREKLFNVTQQFDSVVQRKDDYLGELKRRIDDAEALSTGASEERDRVAEAKERLEEGKARVEGSRKALDVQSKRLISLITNTQSGIREQVDELESKLKQRRAALQDAKRLLIQGKERMEGDKEKVTHRHHQLIQLAEESRTLVESHIENYRQLVKSEKENTDAIKRKLTLGRKKLKEEYFLLLKDIQKKYDALEESKRAVKELDLKLKDGEVDIGKTFADMEQALVKGDNVIYLNLLRQLKHKELDLVKERSGIGRERKLAEKVRKDLETQLERLEDARALREEYEARLEDLKEDERDLGRRERDLERGIRGLEKERERFEREKQTRMEAFAKSDAEIEEGYEELSKRRDDLRREEGILKQERMEFLKESMYYSCPKCTGIIKVKSELRPLMVWCSSCGTEFNLKKAKVYPCLKCGTGIEVDSEERPLDIQCPRCQTEFRLKQDPKLLAQVEGHVHAQ